MKTWILTRYAAALERSFLILDPSQKERLETFGERVGYIRILKTRPSLLI